MPGTLYFLEEKKIEERFLNQEESGELNELLRDGIEYLRQASALSKDTDKPTLIVKIFQEIVSLIMYKSDSFLDNTVLEKASLIFGTLWGNELCQNYRWEWVYLKIRISKKRFEGWAVVSLDRSYACFPHYLFYSLGKKFNEPIVFSLFNMIKSGSLPYSNKYRYTLLGMKNS